jgi:hypothetical protein
MLRFLFLVFTICSFIFLPNPGRSEPRLPDAMNGGDPKVISLHIAKADPHQPRGSLQVYHNKDVFYSVPEDRKKLSAAERMKLNEVTSREWRVRGQLTATGGGGSLAVNEKGEVYVSPQGGSSWEYEIQQGQGARIKCTDPGLEKRYLKVSDKTEDYQFGSDPAVTVKVRRLKLVAEDGDWFNFSGGSR